MSKFIVTTTINKPTVATLKYCEIAVKKNWKFLNLIYQNKCQKMKLELR